MNATDQTQLGQIEQRAAGTWPAIRSLLPALGIAALFGLAGLYTAYLAGFQSELGKQLITASLALLYVACFGGIVKMQLDEAVADKRRHDEAVEAEKRRRDDAATFVTNVLNDLKTVYDQVERARLLIPAHRSAKTYGDEMRQDVTTGVVQLRNVIRALQGHVAGVPPGMKERVSPHVKAMLDYLNNLTQEFRVKYKALADLQRFYEKRADQLTKRFGEGDCADPPVPLPDFAWAAVQKLPVLDEFMNEREGYLSKFIEPLDRASEELRNAHASLIGHRLDG